MTITFKADPSNSIRECSENIGVSVGCGFSNPLVRISTQSICGSTCGSNVGPAALGNGLRAVRQSNDAAFNWTALLSSPISLYRIYKDGVKGVPPATRVKQGEVDQSMTSWTDVGAITALPAPVAYYQAVAVSCAKDLESPY